MSSREIVLWLDERWYQALSQQLEDETVEIRLNDCLDNLISLLPTDVYDKIVEEIDAEHQQKQELESSQKYSAFRVTENGVTEYFRTKPMGILDSAAYVRRWLRQKEQRFFPEMLSGREKISAEEYERIAAGRAEEDQKITGVYDIDLDAQEFSQVRPALGWMTYRLKDVSTASWHAHRTGSYDNERRQVRFMEKLTGRERASAGHLGAENVSFTDEIVENDGRLNFCLENGFNVDRMFSIRTANHDDWLNIYANYNMRDGQVCDELELTLVCADGHEESLSYRLNAAEKAVLFRKMDDYCQQQTGQSLEDYSAQLMAEGMTLPTGPAM